MSTALVERLSPTTYLPDQDQIARVDPATHQFAHAVLKATFPNAEYQHYSRSALAGSALYVASVAVSGPDRVRQPWVADTVGTTEMSIRAHIEKLAQLAFDSVELEEHPAVDKDRLRHLAGGGSARDCVI